MSGTISLSLTQQLDRYGKPLAGGQLWIIQAGTVGAPQNAYQDSGLTIPHPNPITLDAAGRIPQFFLADGQIKVRLTSAAGAPQLVADNLLVVGPSSGGGGGGSVDATTVLATGDIKTRYGTGVLSGFVRMNGRSIGSASSGATERANADTQALFSYLWNADPNLGVSSGRGPDAATDWTANKTLNVPDGRGRILAALDDMGSTPAGRLTSTYFANPTTLGQPGGVQAYPIAATHLPQHQHQVTGTTQSANRNHTHNVAESGGGALGAAAFYGTGDPVRGSAAAGTPAQVATSTESQTHEHNMDFASGGGPGANTPFGILPPMLLITNYLKL